MKWRVGEGPVETCFKNVYIHPKAWSRDKQLKMWEIVLNSKENRTVYRPAPSSLKWNNYYE